MAFPEGDSPAMMAAMASSAQQVCTCACMALLLCVQLSLVSCAAWSLLSVGSWRTLSLDWQTWQQGGLRQARIEHAKVGSVSDSSTSRSSGCGGVKHTACVCVAGPCNAWMAVCDIRNGRYTPFVLPSRACFSPLFVFYQETNTSLDIDIQRGIETFYGSDTFIDWLCSNRCSRLGNL